MTRWGEQRADSIPVPSRSWGWLMISNRSRSLRPRPARLEVAHVDLLPPPGRPGPGPNPRRRAHRPKACSRSSASGNRSAGSFARHRSTTRLQVLGDIGYAVPRGRHSPGRERGRSSLRCRPARRTVAGRLAGNRPPPPASRGRSARPALARRSPAPGAACTAACPGIGPPRLRRDCVGPRPG